MRAKILAVDPGVATGWALWDGYNVGAVGTSDQLAFCNLALGITDDFAPTVIVCESYNITAGTTKMSFQPASLEIIGFLRWLAAFREITFKLQPPSAKSFMPDRKLRSLGWFRRGSEGHDNDALRHLGVYLAEVEKNVEVLRAV